MNFQFAALALNFMFDIFLYAVTLCVFTALLNRIFGKPGPYLKWIQGGLFLAGIFLLILFDLISIQGSRFYELSMAEVPLCLFLLLSYSGSRQKKLFFAFSLFTLTVFYLFCLNDLTNLLHHGLNRYLPFYQIQLFYHIFLWLILFLCQKLSGSFEENIFLPPSLWGFLFGISGALLLIALGFLPLVVSSSIGYNRKMFLHLGLMLLLLGLNYCLFALYKRFYLYGAKAREAALTRQQLEYQEKYYREYLHTTGEIRRLRHDMRNHLRTAAALYAQGKGQELENYLETSQKELKDYENFVMTGNPCLDAVLNLKLQEARQKNICCLTQLTVPENSVFLDFSDTVTILGNLLDNGITSALDFLAPGAPVPEIRLSLIYQEGNLLLHMDNPCKVKQKPPYGIGMKNVESRVEKYQGTLVTEVREGRYYTDILLYGA